MIDRRGVLAAALALPAAARAQGSGQTFDRPLRLIVPNAPGGTSDILARLMAEPLGRALGTTVVVENRTGAGGMVGADVVAKSAPDGTTLLVLDISPLATYPSLFSKMPFDPVRDLAPVQMLIFAPWVMAVANKLPVQDAAGLRDYARAHRGAVSIANSGAGTLTHIFGVSLAQAWGTELIHVPYRGGAPGLLAVASGEADCTAVGATQGLPFVRNGQMRGIAVSGKRRMTELPTLPTFGELGWPLPDAGTWQGLMVAGGTPAPVLAKLEAAAAEVMAQPAIRTRIADLGGEVVTEGAAAFRDKLRADTEALGAIIRANGIKVTD